ncbi:MAG: chromosomal replication initiator DnaA [Silicimonas sp.]|nr:chromosomal replication initiator DnaA [Silicimonas sp.]
MAEQLTFDLPVRESRKRGDFFVSDANALAVAKLEAVETWPNGKLVLVGPEGSGKTHLGHVWAEANDALPGTVGGLLASDIPQINTPVLLETMDHNGPMDAAEEEALFHFHNHMISQGLPFLMLARRPPAQWNIALPDLKSRMEAADIVRIEPPDDALLAAVLLKQFADRQIEVAPSVINFLVTHMNRSFAEAERLVEELDRTALAEARAVTRALAQRVLDKGPQDAR